MCSSIAGKGQRNPPHSSNLDKIEEAAPSSAVEETQDPLESLTSSFLQSAYMNNFGIVDSLTLATQKVRLSNNADYHEDDFEKEEDEDEADAAWRELDSSWEDLVKANPTRHGSCTRRSGVRRGHDQGATDSTKKMIVPTKYNDGPSSATTLNHVE
mmetsp:Transcript_8071/g.18224  ORF Transcript_8071/g.18224 Transcript_8071/m.18224 type:complete len:156 (-) Transcript_8071:224-691(-)|eukprot:CAMPEP_0172299136 /NCGR_PEP_ID=MMETSP1058-20130122/1511_1 /TAXON_ID=83371 /ORGANISM="Detonula confervacea, Strain CCMP 353" /LENGTH=155 /DNA_ID=CAMNT_0013008475 /DNA_START=307 /DNA_END=774 /DNA_ORIENTATION=+